MKFTSKYFSELKRQRARGRCLHFERGDRCDKIISAHSIQNAKQLDRISSDDGHVIQLSADLSILKKNGGNLAAKRVGRGKVSTFLGFCKSHDNELFEPIDKHDFQPTLEQAALYAYRSLCREYFVKENAVRALSNIVEQEDLPPAHRPLIEYQLEGSRIGFDGLRRHKLVVEKSLQDQRYIDFRFSSFQAEGAQPFALAGVLYPHFDFRGYELQEIGVPDRQLDLISFFTAPMDGGWSFCFAWHQSSTSSCEKLMGSLAQFVHDGGAIEDALLRFSVSCCENLAFRESWWDDIGNSAQAELLERMKLMTHPLVPIDNEYLVHSCENISNWKFKDVMVANVAVAA